MPKDPIAAAYQQERHLQATLPLDPHLAKINQQRIQERLLLWAMVIEAGQASRVCDEIVRNRPVPKLLLAALGLAEDDAPSIRRVA